MNNFDRETKRMMKDMQRMLGQSSTSQNQNQKNSLKRLEKDIKDLENKKKKLEQEIKVLEKERRDSKKLLEKELETLNRDVEEVNGMVVVNLVKTAYSYDTSDEYQEKLDKIKVEQKQMVKDGGAVKWDKVWRVDGSKTKGAKQMRDLTKLILKAFNNECDNIIINVKYSTIRTAQGKIEKSFNDINKYVVSNECYITDEYLQLKLEELALRVAYLEKKEEERAELRRQMEMLREQEKLEEEIKKEEEKIEFEQQHYNNELDKLRQQLENKEGNESKLIKQIEKLQKKLVELESRKENVLNRKINNKAGYVYIISNPSLKDMYKIGVTKRLEPMVRVEELSSASLPFKYGVHSFIFSEDAFALETALHKAFDEDRVNKVNKHKEFFAVELEDIKREVLKYNPTAQFIDEVVIEDYLVSMEIA